MAEKKVTVKKTTRKKAPVKKASAEKSIIDLREENKAFLSEVDLVNIRLFEKDKITVRTLLEKQELGIRKIELERENLSLRATVLDNDRAKLVAGMEQIKAKVSYVDRAHKEFMKGLAQKYNLPESWGFNPDSGEIITN